jgi:restriction endonuclease S subunit
MTKMLGEMVDIQSGYHFRGRIEHCPEGDLSIIQAKDVKDNGEIDLVGSYRIRNAESVPKEYLLRENDILLVNRGDNNRAALLQPLSTPVICSSTLYILRTRKPGILPQYLSTFLNLPSTQTALRSTATGATTPLLNRKRLAELPVPVPSVERQLKLRELDALLARERYLTHQILSQRQLLLAGLINQS